MWPQARRSAGVRISGCPPPHPARPTAAAWGAWLSCAECPGLCAPRPDAVRPSVRSYLRPGLHCPRYAGSSATLVSSGRGAALRTVRTELPVSRFLRSVQLARNLAAARSFEGGRAEGRGEGGQRGSAGQGAGSAGGGVAAAQGPAHPGRGLPAPPGPCAGPPPHRPPASACRGRAPRSSFSASSPEAWVLFLTPTAVPFLPIFLLSPISPFHFPPLHLPCFSPLSPFLLSFPRSLSQLSLLSGWLHALFLLSLSLSCSSILVPSSLPCLWGPQAVLVSVSQSLSTWISLLAFLFPPRKPASVGLFVLFSVPLISVGCRVLSVGVGWVPASSLPPFSSPAISPVYCKGDEAFGLELAASWDQAECVLWQGGVSWKGLPVCCQGLIIKTQMAVCVLDGQMDKQMMEKGNTAWKKHPGMTAEPETPSSFPVLKV